MVAKKETETAAVKTFKIEVIVKHRTTDKGAKFNTYALKDKDGKWNDLRFTKDCYDVPKSHSWLYVKSDKIHRDDRNKDYPRFWIHDIESIEEIERPVEDLEQYFDVVD